MTRRSSARLTPRTSVGKCGSIRAHCSSLSQNRFLPMNLSPNTNQYRIVEPERLMSSDPSSVLEKRISWSCWQEKSVRHGQRATLVGLQRNFLCQHDVACDEVTFGCKAPANTRTTGAVEFVDVHRSAVVNPVSFSAVAAGDLKIAFRGILRELRRR